MKKYYSILLAFILSVGLISCCRSSYEDKVWDYIVSVYAEAGIDFPKLINSFETYLIENHVLASTEGTAYYRWYENQLWDTINYSDLSIEGFEDISGLHNLKDEIVNKKFKPGVKQIRLKEKLDSIRVTKTVNPSVMADGITSVLAPADFEHPLYKAHTIAVIYFFILSDQEAHKDITEMHDSVVYTDDMKKLTIWAAPGDSLFVDGHLIEISELANFLDDFLAVNGSQHIIELSNSKKTKYLFYIQVQNILTAAYRSIRNQHAISVYGVPYDDLGKEEQESVKESYPINIMEAKPSTSGT